MDWNLKATLLCLTDLSQSKAVAPLLDLLEKDGHGPPTHWGSSDSLRLPYARKTLDDWMAKVSPENGMVPSVRRFGRPRYLLTWFAGKIHPHVVGVESSLRHEPFEIPALLQLCDCIAGTLEVDFGTIDLRLDGQTGDTLMNPGASGPHVTAYIREGIETIYHRNYFGPRVIKLAGGEAGFASAGGVTRMLPNGTLVLDMDTELWTKSPEHLKARQTTILERLRPLGIITGPPGRGAWSPGPRWEPPPDAWSE